MSRLDGVVLALDVDGVVLDHQRGGRGTWRVELEQRHGVDASALQREFFDRCWLDVVCGKRPIEPALAEALHVLGWRLSVEELLSCWFEADFVVDDHVVAAATEWADAGTRLVLVTDQEHRRAAFLRERLQSCLPFDGIAYSAAVGLRKRDDGFFARACPVLGVDAPTRVVFVDDSLENVEAARRHGWTAVHFTSADGWRAEIEDALRRSCAPPPAAGG